MMIMVVEVVVVEVMGLKVNSSDDGEGNSGGDRVDVMM